MPYSLSAFYPIQLLRALFLNNLIFYSVVVATELLSIFSRQVFGEGVVVYQQSTKVESCFLVVSLLRCSGEMGPMGRNTGLSPSGSMVPDL